MEENFYKEEEMEVMDMETKMQRWNCDMKDFSPRSNQASNSDGLFFAVTCADAVCRSVKRGNNPTAKPYRSMAEREEQRKQRRLELERRYESARKQKEREQEELRAKREAKQKLEMLQKLALVEEKRALFRQRLQMEKLGQQRQQLLKQQHELASLHSSRRILLHYGWIPWSRLLLAYRERLQSARGYYKRRIAKSAFHVLYTHTVDGKTTPRQHARSLSMQAAQFRKKWQLLSWWHFWINMRRADHIYPHGLLRRALITLKEELLELRLLEKFADERNCIRLYHQMWCAWKQYVSSEKSAKLLKYLETDQKASLHARRARHVRVLKAWKEGLAVLHYEKERSLHKAEAWIKIHSWLNGLHQEKSCQLD